MHITDITPTLQKKTEKIRLAPYCRVSSDSADQLHSFAAQIRYYSEYAKRHPECELVDIYADEGITGTDMSKRDDFLRLLRDCKKGLIDRIITKSVSRFARNTEELLETLRMLKSIGVSVYFEEQGIDTDKMNMEMIVTFPGMAAQQESETISGNLRWSIRKRMESGEYNCTYPAFGFNQKNGVMTINETEAIVVRRIFDLYLQGYGLQKIAAILNAEGIPMCGEYDVKTCIAMLIMDSLGIGGSFAEFHPFDFREDFILVGHDGPHHLAIAEGKPILRSLKKYHGKPGHGASVEFKLREGDITMLGITQNANGGFKFVIGEGVSKKGPIPPTGNTNTRAFFEPTTKEFVKKWVMEGPTHHYALGIGHHAEAIAKIAEVLGIEYVIVR